MPLPRRRRTRRSRLLTPLGLGAIAVLTIGSVLVGSPSGAAAGAVDAVAGASTAPLPSSATIDQGTPNSTPTPDIPLAGSLRQELAIHQRVPLLSALTGYRWPLAKGRVTLQFGPTPWGSRVVDGALFHDGVDMATICGDRIIAAHDGIVLAAGRRFDGVMGWVGDLAPYYARLDAKKLWSTLPIVVVIDDGNGYRSMYAHFQRIVVKPGQRVTAGSLIGYEGRTGRASGCHLHYGLFSPLERRVFMTDAAVAKRMRLPLAEIARVDPLSVLPPRPKPAPKPVPTPPLASNAAIAP